MAAALCASYIGGSINFAATAHALGLVQRGVLAACMAADNLAMGVYLATIMAIPDDAGSTQRSSPEQSQRSTDTGAQRQVCFAMLCQHVYLSCASICTCASDIHTLV